MIPRAQRRKYKLNGIKGRLCRLLLSILLPPRILCQLPIPHPTWFHVDAAATTDAAAAVKAGQSVQLQTWQESVPRLESKLSLLRLQFCSGFSNLHFIFNLNGNSCDYYYY